MGSFLATTRAKNLPSTGSGNVITTAAMVLDSGGVNILVLPLDGSQVMSNRMFKIRVAGRAVSGTTSTLTVSAYFTATTPSATVASNGTAFMATSATSLASVKQSFFLEATCFYNADSTTIQGYYVGQIADTLIDLTAITTTSLTTVSATTEGQLFSLAVLFGTTNASNNCIIDEFEIEPL